MRKWKSFLYFCRGKSKRTSMAYVKKVVLGNRLEEIEKLFSLTAELQGTLGLPEEIVFNLNLGLEEALTNVILYAYPGADGEIELLAEESEGTLRFTIQDSGIAFNPLEEAPEADITSAAEEREIGGLGVYLMKQLMDEITYERKNGQNILCMKKNYKP